MSPMKILLAAVCLAAFAMHYVQAIPTLQDIENMELLENSDDFEKIAVRHSRMLCDDTIKGGAGHKKACVAKCQRLGFRGGKCKGGVCTCGKRIPKPDRMAQIGKQV